MDTCLVCGAPCRQHERREVRRMERGGSIHVGWCCSFEHAIERVALANRVPPWVRFWRKVTLRGKAFWW